MRIPVADLPVAHHPGEPGIHRHNGSVAIPLGLNVYKSPKIAERRFWDAARRAGGRDSEAGRYPALTTCSSCSSRIGRGYVQREIYLVATELASRRVNGKMVRAPKWRFLCGICATLFLPEHTEMPLDPGFLLLSESDWGTPECHDLHLLSREIVTRKVRDLNRQLLPAWNEHFRRVLHAHRGPVTPLERDQMRNPLFERFVYAFVPAPLTYRDLLLPRAA